MRPDLVVLAPELLDKYLRIDAVLEPLHAETLVAELAVEGLVRSVLPGFAEVDQGRVDVLAGQPAQDRPGDELGLLSERR